MTLNPFPRAIVAHANNAQFSPGQRIHYSRVESRMLVWCKAGAGTVKVNDVTCRFEPGRYLVLPWAHDITYQAEREDPFLTAGIHIIPDHTNDTAVQYAVAHLPDSPLAGARSRKDVKIPELEGVKEGVFHADDPLPHLAEHIVRVFIRRDPPEWQARQLARLLLQELVLAAEQHEVYEPGAPPELERLKEFVLFHLGEPLSLRDLVEFSELSPSTIGRLFRKHLNTTPGTWILQAKMEKARELLRTRRLTVAEVGERVGIDDPQYFSRCFRRTTGESPQEHRRARRWM